MYLSKQVYMTMITLSGTHFLNLIVLHNDLWHILHERTCNVTKSNNVTSVVRRSGKHFPVFFTLKKFHDATR